MLPYVATIRPRRWDTGRTRGSDRDRRYFFAGVAFAQAVLIFVVRVGAVLPL